MQSRQYLTFFSTFHLACKEASFRTGVFSTMSELYVLLFYSLICSIIVLNYHVSVNSSIFYINRNLMNSLQNADVLSHLRSNIRADSLLALTRTKDKSGHELNTQKQSSFSKKGKTNLKRRSLIWTETPSNCYVWSNLARTRLAKTKNSFISSPPGVVNNCSFFFVKTNQ